MNRKTQFLIAGIATYMLSTSTAITAQDAAPQKAPESAKLYSPDNDALFGQPYIDVEEWRDAPVRHRYVHGGFRGTTTKFSVYLPPKAQYGGHFYQYITPVPLDENISQKDPIGELNKIGMAMAAGAYYVETNGGGNFDIGKAATSTADPTIAAYRANAAAAAYSRAIAKRFYGTQKRPFGFAFGGSGGAYRTIGSFENTTGVWDGAVPFVMGSNMALPNMFTFRVRALRVLGPKFDGIVDAVEPGGNRDMYAGLDPVETDVLREATRMGFPPQSWFGWRTMGIHGFSAIYPAMSYIDPGYFNDFWSKPGYLGHDHPEQFSADRLQSPAKIIGVLTAADAARAKINIDASSDENQGGVDSAFHVPEGAEAQRIVAFRLGAPLKRVRFLGGDLVINSGAAKGKRLSLARIVQNDIVVLGTGDKDVAAQIKEGDDVVVDNSNFLAMETYHRHQVPDASYKVWDQFRKADGTPLYPQRPMLLGPIFVKGTGGAVQTGKWAGKMIVVESLWDREALAWQADWYRELVKTQQGPAADGNFRLWYTDHALHADASTTPGMEAARIVTYVPIVFQALRDLSRWAEKGIAPPASTAYQVVDGQIRVPASATERKGVQPVVTLTVARGDRVDVRKGSTVAFNGSIEVPPGAGALVAAAWDFDGKGTFAVDAPVRVGNKAQVQTTHRFDLPGTYFVALRGTSQRQGDRKTPYFRISNIARVRVVVR